MQTLAFKIATKKDLETFMFHVRTATKPGRHAALAALASLFLVACGTSTGALIAQSTDESSDEDGGRIVIERKGSKTSKVQKRTKHIVVDGRDRPVEIEIDPNTVHLKVHKEASRAERRIRKSLERVTEQLARTDNEVAREVLEETRESLIEALESVKESQLRFRTGRAERDHDSEGFEWLNSEERLEVLREAMEQVAEQSVELQEMEAEIQEELAEARKELEEELAELGDFDLEISPSGEVERFRFRFGREASRALERAEREQLRALRRAEEELKRARERLERRLEKELRKDRRDDRRDDDDDEDDDDPYERL